MDYLTALIAFIAIAGVFAYFTSSKKRRERSFLDWNPVRISFKEGIPTDSTGEKRNTIKAKKLVPLIFSSVIGLALFSFIWTMAATGYREYLLYIALLTALLLYYINDLVAEVEIYDHLITYRNIFGKKKYYYSSIDYVEAFNIINMFKSSVGSGYVIKKNDKVLCRLENSRFTDLYLINEYFTGHPAVQKIDNIVDDLE